jgi:hypothetical protein
MVLLPALVLGSQIERPRVLEIWRQDYSFVASFAGKLNSEIPRIESYKGEVEVLRDEVFRGKRIEAVDCVAESSCIAYMLPSKCCQAC